MNKDVAIGYGKGIGFAVVAVVLIYVAMNFLSKSINNMPQVKALSDKLA